MAVGWWLKTGREGVEWGGGGMVRVGERYDSPRANGDAESVVVIFVVLSLSLSCHLSPPLSLSRSSSSLFYFFYSHLTFFRSLGFEVGVAIRAGVRKCRTSCTGNVAFRSNADSTRDDLRL